MISSIAFTDTLLSIFLSFFPSTPHSTGLAHYLQHYYVTNWQTGEMKEIPYRGSYKKFIFQIGVSFNSGTKKRLYKLMPGATHAERTEIKSTADLEAALEWIDKNVDNNDESLQILYLYPEEVVDFSRR